jgi:hypothetical protein
MSPQTTGRALVILRANDYAYMADVVLQDGLAFCSNVARRLGRGEDAWLQPAADRVWPARELREVRWLKDGVAA